MIQDKCLLDLFRTQVVDLNPQWPDPTNYTNENLTDNIVELFLDGTHRTPSEPRTARELM